MEVNGAERGAWADEALVGAVEVGDEVIVNPGISCGRCLACLSGRDNYCRDYRLLGEDCTGGYGEYLVVPAQNLVPKPASLSFAEAACLPTAYLTVYRMLFTRARLEPGQTCQEEQPPHHPQRRVGRELEAGR